MLEEKDFNIFAASDTGIFKGVNINEKCCLCKNFDKPSNLTKEDGITCLSFGSDETEVLVGLRGQTVKVFDVKTKSYSSCFATRGGSGPLVGVARYEDSLLTGAESGLVKLWRHEDEISFNPIETEVLRMGKLGRKNLDWTEEQKEKHAENLKIGRKLCRLRQCAQDRRLVAVGGKEVDLQVWDLTKLQEPIFRAKNVRSDFLELRVPVWVSDLSFISQDSVATCSRYGYIRKYDIRSSQRRPVSDLVWTEKEENQTCTAVCSINSNQVLVGTATGKLGLWDFRSGTGYKGLVRKYKGCVGAVREICSGENSDYFSVVGLDRYLRVYNIKGEKPLFNSYLKSKLTGVLMTSSFDPYRVEVDKTAEPADPVGVIDDDDDDDGDIMIVSELHPEEDKEEEEVDVSVLVAVTKLENLLSLPESTYKDKSNPFYEFFLNSKKQRRLLKTTDSESERESALIKLRQMFLSFQKGHSKTGLKPPTKKRKISK